MRLPVIQGLIRRRMLVNYRVAPETIQRLLPAPFRPKLHRGHAIAGICLIRLEQIRPAGFPAALGLASENSAHRIAVTWTETDGTEREGVFIPRRDTSSMLNHLAGGRIFPGEHHLAKFDVVDSSGQVSLHMHSRDDGLRVEVKGQDSDEWPATCCFSSLAESSEFFRGGSLGYSVTSDPCRLDGLELQTSAWSVRSFVVDEVSSSYFENLALFPDSSVTFDHALIMRDIPHEWHQVADMACCSTAT